MPARQQQLTKPLPARPRGAGKGGAAGLIQQFRLPGDVAGAHPLRQSLKQLGTRLEAHPDLLDDLLLAVTEAFSNAIRHGAVTEDGGINVAISCTEDGCRVTLHYPGDPFPLVPPQLPDDSSTTGRGRYLMSVLCDRIDYEFDAGETRITLSKRWR